MRFLFWMIAAASVAMGFTPKPPDTLLIRAMQSELHRSMDSLRLKGQEGPYFLSYMLWDVQGYRIEASMGAVETANPEPLRLVDVDLRVGSYEHDQSQYVGGFVGGPRLSAPIPQGNDTLLLRQALWAQTDARYKVALEQLAQKQSFLASHHGMDALPDWSKQKVLQQQDIDPIIPPDTGVWVELCRKLSGVLADYGWLSESRVGYQYFYTTFYYVDSEGATYIQSLQENALLAALLCQAQDGAPLWDYLRIAARDSLSKKSVSFETLQDSLKALVQRMDKLRQSPPVGFYRGPVLFAGSAAGEVVQHTLLDPQNRLRAPLGENTEQPFLLSLQGRKYLPDNFSVRDVPGMRRYNDKELFGSYAFDHQGQTAEDISLVENGRLVDFYRGKLPLQSESSRENGHWRYGGGFPGVVKFDVSGTVSEQSLLDSLKARAHDEGTPFGLRVSKFTDDEALRLLRHPLAQSIPTGGFAAARGTFSLPAPVTLDAVDDNTGEIIPLRGLSFNALDSKSLRDIAAAGDVLHVLEPQASFSVLCPSLLFSLLDLGGSRQTQPHLPLLP